LSGEGFGKYSLLLNHLPLITGGVEMVNVIATNKKNTRPTSSTGYTSSEPRRKSRDQISGHKQGSSLLGFLTDPSHRPMVSEEASKYSSAARHRPCSHSITTCTTSNRRAGKKTGEDVLFKIPSKPYEKLFLCQK